MEEGQIGGIQTGKYNKVFNDMIEIKNEVQEDGKDCTAGQRKAMMT